MTPVSATKKTARPSRRSSPWYQSEFFDNVRVLIESQDRRQATADARYLIDKLGLKRGSTFLDCPCGIGRISIPLAQRGIRVTGVDLTPSYLAALTDKVTRTGLPITMTLGDMRRIDFSGKFDAAGNLGGSFGYFENKSDDFRTLKKLFQALKPGGRVVLNTINRDWIIASFQSRGYDQFGDTFILQQRRLDYETSVLHSTWQVFADGRRSLHEVSIRIYSLHELLEMFGRVGFVDCTGYGDTDDLPVHFSRRLIWLFARKPK